jgi:chromosomal replication initiation ATPase DnaA
MKLDIILREVNDKLNIDIKRETRKRKYVYGRMLFIKLAKDFNPYMSTTQIGRFINKDHATVLYSLRQFKNIKDYQQDRHFLDNYNSLFHSLKQTNYIFSNNDNRRTNMILKNLEPLKRYYAKPI